MRTLQLNVFDLLSNLPGEDGPKGTLEPSSSVSAAPIGSSILMDALLVPQTIPEDRPADPGTPPVTGEGIPPVIARVFVSKKWQGRQSYYGHLYGWKTHTGSGKVTRFGIVTLDGQDYRKGHFYIDDKHLSMVNGALIDDAFSGSPTA